MGCEELLAKPWNLRAEDSFMEFRFERGNQWLITKRKDSDNWTPDVWNRFYGCSRGVGEGLSAQNPHP